MVVNGFDMWKTLAAFSYWLSISVHNVIKILYKLTREVYLCAQVKKSTVESVTNALEALISPLWSLCAPRRLCVIQ